MSLNIDKELSVREYALRENSSFHAPYVPEFDFYYAVKAVTLQRWLRCARWTLPARAVSENCARTACKV